MDSSPTNSNLPRWRTWITVAVFTFLAFESAVLAVALKDRWLVLLAPAAVCGLKAFDAWRQMKDNPTSNQS